MFGEDTEVEVEDVVDGKKITVTETKKVYHLTTTVTECKEYTEEETKEYVEAYKERIIPVAQSGEVKADKFGIADGEKDEPKTAMVEAFQKLDCSEDIDSVAKVSLEVMTQTGQVVATQTVFVVKIGNSWYVDNTNISTRDLYLAS